MSIGLASSYRLTPRGKEFHAFTLTHVSSGPCSYEISTCSFSVFAPLMKSQSVDVQLRSRTPTSTWNTVNLEDRRPILFDAPEHMKASDNANWYAVKWRCYSFLKPRSTTQNKIHTADWLVDCPWICSAEPVLGVLVPTPPPTPLRARSLLALAQADLILLSLSSHLCFRFRGWIVSSSCRPRPLTNPRCLPCLQSPQ